MKNNFNTELKFLSYKIDNGIFLSLQPVNIYNTTQT
ncbi:hypothetical protein BDD43_0073 [Mucilaginibacter gracilis]|uniref:Uncharacterized protein n=1 Tax=Mucilaginibacter gracilis TaxID=423350 RepID=A0A495IT79_9SPHI|nr:hypothetical protein BDD43_0073 [Mucilaginibacter gracilis]